MLKMQMIINEQAGLRDIPELLEFETSCFSYDLVSAKEFRYYIKAKTIRVMVMRDQQQDKIMAVAILFSRKNSSIYRLYSFAVHPDYRKIGLAQKLQQLIEEEVKRWQGKKWQGHHESSKLEIRLEVRKTNRRAIRFYKQQGYQICGEYDNFHGRPAWRMAKEIK